MACLYLVADDSCLRSKISLEEAVEQAILGGVNWVQLREKTANCFQFYQQAKTIKAICQSYQVPLIINDRLDIALAVDADGVHLGQNDLPAKEARKILGNKKILGVSARTLEQAAQAQYDGADYLGVGAIFATTTKHDAKTITLATFLQMYQNVDLPMMLIGGIHQQTLPVLQQTLSQHHVKIAGVAVVSAILAQENIHLASQQLKQIMETGSCYQPKVL